MTTSITYPAEPAAEVKSNLLDEQKPMADYIDGKYYNINRDVHTMSGGFFTMMRKWIFGKEQRVPPSPLPAVQIDTTALFSGDSPSLKFTWLGHSTVLIRADGYTILTDPNFSGRVTIVGPVRFKYENLIHAERIPKIDLVLISHNHADHLDYKTIKLIKDRVKKFIVPQGVGNYLEKCKVSSDKIIEMNWWEEQTVDSALTIAAAPAQHFSGRGLTDSNKSLWASWVIMTPDHRIYFSGDTGYSPAFAEIGRRHGPFDLTMIENGAYGEEWSTIHLLPEQVIQAHLELRGELLLPVHWGGFNLAYHDWDEPIKRLMIAGADAGIKIATPKIGEVVDTVGEYNFENWWEIVRR